MTVISANNSYRLLGVLGGTFDPIHYGHLRPALDVLDDLSLDELRLIPSHTPPHRATPGATVEQRVDMVRLALAGEPRFGLDEREIKRQGPSYMVDTLASLVEDEAEDTALVLIMGGDAFLGLPQWHKWPRLLEMAHIVVTHRPGWQPPRDGICGALLEHSVANADALRQARSGLLMVHKVTQLDISATGIRRRIGAGKSPRFLLPSRVIDYIEDRQLYR